METKVIKLDPSKPDVSLIREAAQIVDNGGLAAFPTDTVYGIACRVQESSLEKLNSLKGRTAEKFYTLHIGQKSDIIKYVPTLGLKAQKIIKNLWPGPLTIVFELSKADIEILRANLDKGIFDCLYRDNSIGIRCPDNLIAAMMLQMTKYPVVAPSANITGQPPSVDAEQVSAQFGDQIDVLLDGGITKYQQSSTVVKISRAGMQILRPGVYSASELQETSEVNILFVCSGNTCRSPMAAGIFGKYLAEKLEVQLDLLEKIGYKLLSAGTLGMSGMPATAEAIAACAAKGIDISSHRSTGLSRQLVNESDIIFAMGRVHRQLIASISTEAAEKCMLLADNEDVCDPIGKPQRVYNECAERIEKAVKKRVSELVL